MNEKRIAGPYDPLYADVTRKLRDDVEGYLAPWIYFAMVSFFYVEEEWGDDPVWVHGIVRAAKTQIVSESGVLRGSFYRAWQNLVDAGMVKEQEDGTFLLPFYKKKGYDAISAREIRERQQRSEKEQEEANMRLSRLEELHETDLDVPGGQEIANLPQKEPKRPHEEAKRPHEEAKRPHEEASPSFLKAFKKSSLSVSKMNKLISGFYRSIGQKRIPGPVREKALKSFQKLMKAGYKPGEIEFALGWIPENAEEPIKHFGIVPHMIEQALESRRKELEIQEAEQAKEESREEAERNRLDEQQEREALENYKAQLSDQEREELRNDALLKLRGTPGIKTTWIAEPLIEAQENELIRNASVDLTAFSESDD